MDYCSVDITAPPGTHSDCSNTGTASFQPPPCGIAIPTPEGNKYPLNTNVFNSCQAILWVEAHQAEIINSSSRHGVPSALVAGIIASEIDLDTDLKDLGVDAAFRLKNDDVSKAMIMATWFSGKPLGPGTASLHYATWKTISQYYQVCDYDLGGIVPPWDSHLKPTLAWVYAVLTPPGAIEGAAATSRFLADYRTGTGGQPNKTTHFGGLAPNDMALIYGAYRAGVGGLTCFASDPNGCGYLNVAVFQNPDQPLGPEATQSLPYFVYFSEYFRASSH